MRRLIAHVQSTPTLWDDVALMFGLAFVVGVAAPLLTTAAVLAVTRI